jgi:DNA-binding CsgD family transcriptional regulator
MFYPLDDLSVSDILSGFRVEADGRYVCVLCGEGFDPGRIYPLDGAFYEARRAAEIHARTAHGDYFCALLEDSKYLPLTDNQRELLTMMRAGMSDGEIAKELNVSPSTVRNQRFTFREKAKRAKMYLAACSLVMEAPRDNREEIIPMHDSANMVDERYATTEAERAQVYKTFFLSVDPPRLKQLPAREKKKLVALARIAEEFSPGERYSEKRVNEILVPIHEDYATLRRYLIGYGFLDRVADGSAYWRK